MNRLPFSLCLGALLAITSAPGCAPLPEDEDAVGEVAQAQFPVDLRVGELWFDDGPTPFLRIAVTGDGLPRTSSYAARTEYWAGSTGVAAEDLRSLQMGYAPVSSPPDAQLRSFLAPSTAFAPPFATAQVISTSRWTAGAYRSSAAHQRLFKAADPSDPRHSIALLIEQDAGRRFVGGAWYKTSNTTWTILSPIPSSLTWATVSDASGNPSLDPADIERTTWYHYAF